MDQSQPRCFAEIEVDKAIPSQAEVLESVEPKDAIQAVDLIRVGFELAQLCETLQLCPDLSNSAAQERASAR